jgi:hypothetical protein
MISIVDDDESVRESTKALVRSLGYAARAFASAEEFLGVEPGRHELPDRRCPDGRLERIGCSWNPSPAKEVKRPDFKCGVRE